MADAPRTYERANELHLVVLTPTKKLFDTSCQSVSFPGAEGILGILPQHAPLISRIGTGVMHFEQGQISTFATISGGTAEVAQNQVTLLVDFAEEASTIDLERAKQSLEHARSRLSSRELGSPGDYASALAAEARAQARIDAAHRFQSARK